MHGEQSEKIPDYRAYTTEFDKVVSANEFNSVLGPMTIRDRDKLDEAWDELQSGLVAWKTKLHIASIELCERLRSGMSRDQRASAVVTLLSDQSGSMHGQKMLFSAASADVAQELLASLSISCEVLGFRTSRWLGGRSRRRWKWRLSPRNPGRLNDLLHVVYREADDHRTSTGGWTYRQMLRADFPKQNIDGEAIIWALSRLYGVNRQRKILIVLSDGAPVDDSTLRENGPHYLSDHLRKVVEDTSNGEQVEIAALGIGFAAHPFYPRTHFVEEPSKFGVELLKFITDLLLNTERPTAKSTLEQD